MAAGHGSSASIPMTATAATGASSLPPPSMIPPVNVAAATGTGQQQPNNTKPASARGGHAHGNGHGAHGNQHGVAAPVVVKRTRRINIGPGATNIKFAKNSVTTSKYNICSYIPKSLLEQFRRLANFYFLFISILQMSTDLSPTGKYATIEPLAVVLVFTMIKEGVEDLARHRADRKVNEAPSQVVRDGRLIDVQWREIRVGDIVRVRDGEPVPADIVVLSSAGNAGVCNIETSNLDGETNLKVKTALDMTQGLVWPSADSPEALRKLSSWAATLECEESNKDLYDFEGHITINGKRHIVSLKSVIWRGTSLVHTSWIYGLVFFTGQDTKLIRNSRAAPSKRSAVDKMVNTTVIIIFITLAVMATASTILNLTYLNSTIANQSIRSVLWYLPFLANENGGLDILRTWTTFLILYNNLVPISLYISLEFVKLFQARMIGEDIHMYHEETGSRAMARTSNLNDDLGQIQYIFSDKTGTLTCNKMEFHRCSVGGIPYGADPDENGQAANGNGHSHDKPERSVNESKQRGSKNLASAPSASKQEATFVNVAPPGAKKRPAPVPAIEGYNFDDRQFLRDMRGTDKQADALREFCTALAVCHTVVVHTDEHGEHHYRASSPDEAALVIAAKQLGYEFWERSERAIRLRLHDGVIAEYEILAENEFTSDRRCSSTIVRVPATGQIVLYAKGADEAMLPKLRADLQRSEEEMTMQNHLNEFGSEGLRTLVVCRAVLQPDVWHDWNRRYTDIRNDLQMKDKTASLAALAAELEQDLELVGATAIEDKLQDGVPHTIHQLGLAGIKIWMLTGDKLETAQNIGLSCRLLTPDMTVVKINEATHDTVTGVLAQTLKKYQRSIGKSEDKLAILVSGKSLTYVFASDDLRNLFLQLCKMARVVIACRVIPSQKAELVKMVRFGVRPEPMTLAIGDGANDVAMIQEAHVGVGISGNEGMQAVRSSDYSFAQFRFLQRLLFVHGRWSYRRVSTLVLYSFYKNITYILTLFCFGFHNGHSGTTLYEAFLSTGYNIGWTLLPILVIGILEQDIGATAAMMNPIAYGSGHRQVEFNITLMAQWVCNAVLHAIIIYVFGTAAFKNVITAADGQGDGLFVTGTIINMCVTITVNIKVALVTKYWTRVNTAAIILSIAIWCLFVVIYSSTTAFSNDFYGIGRELFSRAHFWFIIILIPITANLVDFAWLHISSIYYPNPVDIVREREMEVKRSGGDADDMAFQAEHERNQAQEVARTMTLPSPHHVRDVSYWAPQIQHLKDVLRGDKEAMALKRSKGLEMTPSLTTTVHRHWFTLAFVSHPALELEFQKQYVLKSVRLTRVILVVVWVLLLVYAIWSTISRDNQYVFRLIATILAGFALAAAWTRYFRKYFNEFIFTVLLIGGMLRSILVTVDGAVGLGMFCILSYLLFRARFITSFLVTTFDLCFYVVWILVATSANRYELLKTVFLDVLLLAFCAYCSHHIESAFRLDFLKQKDFQTEQSRTNSIVENILPPHIIAMQMAAVKARRDKAEQELAAYTQASRQAAGGRTFSGFGAGPRGRKVAPANGATASPPTSHLGMGSARASIIQAINGGFDQANVDMLRRTITSTNRKGGAAQLLLAHSTAHGDAQTDLVPRHLTSPPAHVRPPLAAHAPGHGELKVVEVSLNGEAVTSEVKGGATMTGAHGAMASPSHTMVGNGAGGFHSARSGAITPMDTKMDEDELDELGIFSPNAPPLPPGQEIEHFLSKELSDILVSVEGQVSIIFCDVLDMTVYMQRHSPSVVVTILDTIYSLFDELCVFHGVRKMETVGKTWMGAVGLRGTRKDHALAAVEMAVEMLEIMARCTDPEKKGPPGEFTGITCRIGVHTGYAISGVVGVRRPQFSLFGDTVNTAARVCSNGAENRLHISQPTWQHVHKHYECVPRQITAKGKGVLTTYFIGQRLSRIPLHRKLSYKTGVDEVPLQEVQRLIQISDPTHEDDEFDQYELPDQENPIEIHPFTLQFKKRVMPRATDPSDESVYMHRVGSHFGADSRRPIAAAMMFYLIEAIFEYYDGANPGVSSEADAAYVFAFRYGFVLLGAILLVASYTKHYSRKAPIYNTLIFGLGMLEAIAVPSLRSRDLDGRAVMVFIFCMTLLSNSSTLRFLPNLIVNSVGFIIWCVAANTDILRKRDDSGSDGAIFSFFVFAGSLCNIVASYVRENYQRRDFVLTRRVEEEKDRSNQFLFFTLPPFVAKSLREGHYGISEKCEGVTILYSDIKGFTKYSASSTPENVVQLLSQLFSAFDRLTEYHGVYKVQTIGDAYVIVAGFPFLDEEVQRRHRMTRKPDAADHANNMVRMAMDMLGVIKRVPTAEGSGVQMRLGIHTGEVIAGCIGTKQLRYDIWGNDCLVANSMESNGIPSGVVVSYSTAELIRTKYRLVRREPIVIKNKKYDNYAVQCPIDQPEKRLRTKYDEHAEALEEEKKAREKAANAPSTPSAFAARHSTIGGNGVAAGSAATTPKPVGSTTPAAANASPGHGHNHSFAPNPAVAPELRPNTSGSTNTNNNDEKKR